MTPAQINKNSRYVQFEKCKTFPCPKCGGRTTVSYTKSFVDPETQERKVRRFKRCLDSKCANGFHTIEILEAFVDKRQFNPQPKRWKKIPLDNIETKSDTDKLILGA